MTEPSEAERAVKRVEALVEGDAQRELAEQLRRRLHESVCAQLPEGGLDCDEIVAEMLPLIADAEKRAAAAELRDYGDWLVRGGRASAAEIVELRSRAAALGGW